jgi:hypothetical protein
MSSDLLVAAPADFVWLEPWEPVSDSADILICELRRELAEEHVLFKVPVAAVARRTDSDDVLFATIESSKPLAVVHLTWSGRSEPDPLWPHTTLYDGWQDWIVRCQIPDHRDWLEKG